MKLEEALQRRGIPFHRSRTDRNEITLCCPFCVTRNESPDEKFRLGINTASGKAHCFNCKWSSLRVWGPIARALRLGMLQEGRREKKSEEAPRVELPEDFELLASKAAKSDFWGRKARKYLQDRGVTYSQMVRHRIGYSMAGRYAYRIVFPVIYKAELKGLVGRLFVPGENEKRKRYLNSVGIKSVYNCPHVKKRKAAIIVEGIFKCLAVERSIGSMPYDVLALLGNSMTEEQEEMLDGYARLTLWPDPDKQGTLGMAKVANQLSGKFRVFWVQSTVAKSPDDMTSDEIQQQIPESVLPWGEGIELRNRARMAFMEE